MNSNNQFFDAPIINSPYKQPTRHWEFDDSGLPTERIIEKRRPVSFFTPVPIPKKRVSDKHATEFDFLASSKPDEFERDQLAQTVNSIRDAVNQWRTLTDSSKQRVTPETSRLLHHWRNHPFNEYRPFFCQIEAIETLIWLTEAAPKLGEIEKQLLEKLAKVSFQANSDLSRLALKLATGAGKTTIMAMVIAWQTINSIRHPNNTRFTHGFLVVTPGITIKDRLRVLQPNDPECYYLHRELVPKDMLDDINQARIVITNFHAFSRREIIKLPKTSRAFLEGSSSTLNSLETEGQMIQRVMPRLQGMKRILALNDEAHHCYQQKLDAPDEGKLKGDDLKEAKKNRANASLWYSGLISANKLIGITKVLDLSATPFFLRGSGYPEGVQFPWTISDFSLMDAIECGIVKLPRVPVADNLPNRDIPMLRNLWEHIRNDMPKKGRNKTANLDPLSLPAPLQTALQTLYGHYEETYLCWQKAGIKTPPCFIVICNNTSTSKLVYDYIAGFQKKGPNGLKTTNGRLKLFRNFDDNGNRLGRPRTLLIDSEQIESGEALDDDFRKLAAEDIERFRRARIQRTGDYRAGDNISDQDLLREVMNSVGKLGQLGENIRCVVSVSMLTEGWDANTVTHVLGVRAFGTQLLCEQAVGRALRRLSYELDAEDRFAVEYADVLGIPFDFTAEPVSVDPPVPPQQMLQVKAITPDRDALEIRFPCISGYRVELPEESLRANFNIDSTLELTPELVGPSLTRNEGIIGKSVDFDLTASNKTRSQTVLYNLTQRLLDTKWRDSNNEPKLYLFGQLKRIVRQWFDNYLVCRNGTSPAQLMYMSLADMACERIMQGIVADEHTKNQKTVKAIVNPYNPTGSTIDVNFKISTEKILWKASSNHCHLNWIVCDSDWEAQFCPILEKNSFVHAYVKNHRLGLEVPYIHGRDSRIYLPDFIVLVNDGNGMDDLLHLIIEIKGLCF